MYKSPVEIVVGEMKNQQENYILSVIQEMGVNVDKTELIKALEYDRKQYEKGYVDGIKEFENRAKHVILIKFGTFYLNIFSEIFDDVKKEMTEGGAE